MREWPLHYVLVDRVPFAVDLMTWARTCEQRSRDLWRTKTDPWRVARTDIDSHCYVSTVFLGMDHGWGRGDPVLFETMVFGGPLGSEQWRYCTWAEAERGHEEMVVQARKAGAQIASIADATGAKA